MFCYVSSAETLLLCAFSSASLCLCLCLQRGSRRGPTLGECMLLHAVARLALFPAIVNIQASWVKMGPHHAAGLLAAGVNDLGGVLMNESITKAAGERLSALRRARSLTPFHCCHANMQQALPMAKSSEQSGWKLLSETQAGALGNARRSMAALQSSRSGDL